MKYNNFIWDWDGTLFDSYPVMQKNLSQALKMHGLEANEENLLAHMKTQVKEYVETLAKSKGLSACDILNTYKELGKDSETKENLYPFSGIKNVLKALKENGAKNFVYTHRGRDAIEISAFHGLTDYIDGFLCQGDQGFERKPARGGLDHIIEKYGLDRAKTLMIGDRELDINAAHNAEIDGLLFLPDGFLIKMNGVKSAKNSEELIKLLLE